MTSLLQDLRLAVRCFLRSPQFTLVAVLTLALGIGATSSIFSVVNGVLLRPLPYPDSDRLVRLYATRPGEDRSVASGPDFIDWREGSESFEAMAAYRWMNFNLAEGDWPVRLSGISATPDLLSVLGVDALLGRTLSPEIDVPGAARAVVLGYGLWESRFAADPAVLGRQLTISGDAFTVVGVMPAGFDFPGGSQLWISARYRVPEPYYDRGEGLAEVRDVKYLSAVGRLKPGVSLREARAEMGLISERLAEAYPESNRLQGINLLTLRESVVGSVRPLLLVLLGAVGFVLLIACANVANLLLARASGREKEIAVRMALGASRWRILRLLVTESVLLALLGGFAGFLLALWGTSGLLALAPEWTPRLAEVGTDAWVLAFTIAVALLTGVAFGLTPAFHLSRLSLQQTMQTGAGRQTAGRGRSRLRKGLVVCEMAVTLLLLVGAGLMVRTLLTLSDVDPGFDYQNTLRAHLELPKSKYAEDAQLIAFYRQTLERVRALPGVRSTAFILSLPIGSAVTSARGFAIEGRPLAEGGESLAGYQGPLAGYQLASPDYFATLRIPLLRGRFFTEADDENAPSVVLINQALADRYWSGEIPIGQRMTLDDPESEDADWATIVGIVGDTRYDGLDAGPRPEVYRPYAQAPPPFMTLVVRAEGEFAGLSSAVRNAVMEVDPQQPVYDLATMDDVLSESISRRRFGMFLFGLFAAAAIVMATVGLYGVLAFSVARRTNEIGIRVALGARPQQVVAHIVREGLWLGLAGLASGAIAAFALTRLMSSLIFGVGATDPITFGVGAALLLAIALLASYVPARRAAGIDPVVALKQE
jgi:putative ABC transport system permease protein